MSAESYCPFSKPIIGQYCSCKHARLAERCSGKMACAREVELLPECEALADEFKLKAHFVLCLSSQDEELTHAQLMKIRCSGLLGMQRVLKLGQERVPDVREVIEACHQQYGSCEAFPFNEIMPDIHSFSHRKRRSS